MSAVTANISKYRTKSGIRYRVRITNRRLKRVARPFNRAGFRTRREAEDYARSVREKVARLERGEVEFGKTIGELVDRYERDAAGLLNATDRRVRVTQLRWWRDFLGSETALADVSPRRITEGLKALAKKPRASRPRGKRQPFDKQTPRIVPATINRYRAALSAVFAFAIKDLYWIDRNPVHHTRTLRESRGRVRWLEPDELKRLGEAVDAQSGHLPIMFWLALSTGARQGEILSARWSQVSFEKRDEVTISLDKTKSGERRVLPVILPKAVCLLREQKLRFGSSSDLVIPTERPGKKHHRWRKFWVEALKQAEIEDFRFHDLRHCFASYLAMQGHDAIQIADLTGHKSLAMVKRYSHLNPASRQRNAKSALVGMGLLQSAGIQE